MIGPYEFTEQCIPPVMKEGWFGDAFVIENYKCIHWQTPEKEHYMEVDNGTYITWYSLKRSPNGERLPTPS